MFMSIGHNHGIITPVPIPKPPMFSYAAFCKKVSVCAVDHKIRNHLNNPPSISLQNLNNKVFLVMQEIFKLFMKQISSLKSLHIYGSYFNSLNIYSRAKDHCQRNLSKL